MCLILQQHTYSIGFWWNVDVADITLSTLPSWSQSFSNQCRSFENNLSHTYCYLLKQENRCKRSDAFNKTKKKKKDLEKNWKLKALSFSDTGLSTCLCVGLNSVHHKRHKCKETSESHMTIWDTGCHESNLLWQLTLKLSPKEDLQMI